MVTMVFPVLHQRFESSPSVFSRAKCRNIVCVECKPMVIGLVILEVDDTLADGYGI